MDSKRRYRTSSVDPDEDTNVSHIDTRGRAFGALLSHFNTPLDDGFERNNTQIQDTTSIDPYQTAQSSPSPLPRSSTSNLAEDSPSTSPYLDTIGIEDSFSDRTFGSDNEYRIVLIGKTGAGKSATANTLIGAKHFNSHVSGISVTKQCKKVEGYYDGKPIVVVDTPGMFDTCMTKEELSKEIMKCVGISSPGPHAFVLVVPIGRITREEQETVQNFEDFFGEKIYKFMIILFTRVTDIEDEGTKLEDYIHTIPGFMRTVLRRCGYRYLGYNNKATGKANEKQVSNFFQTLNRMVESNNESYYTNDLFYYVEVELQKRLRERKQQLEKQKQDKMEQIKKDLENKIQVRKAEVQRMNESLALIQANRQLAFRVLELKTTLLQHMSIIESQKSPKANGYDELNRIQQEIKDLQKDESEKLNLRCQQEMDDDEKRIIDIKQINSNYHDKLQIANLRKEERDDIVKGKSSSMSSIRKAFIKGCKVVVGAVAAVGAIAALFA